MDHDTQVSRSGIVELRLYVARRGRRDEMARLFDAEVVEALEAAGAEVMGQFVDLDRRTGWGMLRGFPDPAARKVGLERFYGGDYWRTRGPAFNATLSDCSNVRLLRPVRDDLRLRWHGSRPVGEAPGTGGTGSTVLLTLLRLTGPIAGQVVERRLAPAVAAAGVDALGACYETHDAPDTYPRLPIVTGEHALAHVVVLPDPDVAARVARSLTAALTGIPELTAAPEHRRLSPTARSLLR